MRKAVYVAATRQHVGKSSVCLGLMSSLIHKFQPGNVGFIKPIGQRHTTDPTTGDKIDTDVTTVVDYFGMTPTPNLKAMSPIVVDRGYTRKLWSQGGLNNTDLLEEKKQTIVQAFDQVCEAHAFTVVEGTGHTGVGSCIGLNNAQVAKLLGLDMVFIANGGLGQTYDELALNIGLARLEGASIGGVVINKVQPNKLTQVQEFFEPVLDQWNVPLVGIVPYGEALDSPTMRDYEELFGTERLSGKDHDTHYTEVQIVATGLRKWFGGGAKGTHGVVVVFVCGGGCRGQKGWSMVPMTGDVLLFAFTDALGIFFCVLSL